MVRCGVVTCGVERDVVPCSVVICGVERDVAMVTVDLYAAGAYKSVIMNEF